jgi:hypothetical protein
VGFVRGTRRIWAGSGLVAAATMLSACATAAPPHAAAVHSATAASTTVNDYSVPLVQKGEVARIIYTRPGSVDGVSVDVPASTVGYDIDSGCKSAHPAHKIGFELLQGTTMIVKGSTICDGIPYRDTAIVPDSPAETVHLVFTGDMSAVSDAYLVLFPSNDN